MNRAAAFVILIAVFLYELCRSGARVAIAVLRPQDTLRPAIVGVPLDLRTDFGIALLANLVTLTPGTTSLHVSEDRSTLYVHVLDEVSREETVASIKSLFERLVRRIEG